MVLRIVLRGFLWLQKLTLGNVDGGSSEMDVGKDFITGKGEIPTNRLVTGSYNYYDFSNGPKAAWCHVVVDIAPTFWYAMQHSG